MSVKPVCNDPVATMFEKRVAALKRASASFNLRHIVRLSFLMITVASGTAMHSAMAAGDYRQEILLHPDDRTHCLGHMREYMEVATGILSATLEEDMDVELIIRLARKTQGRNAREADPDAPRVQRSEWDENRPVRMRAALPDGYRQMLGMMREGFSEIARDAKAMADPLHTQRQLVRVQNTCIACHASYKLTPLPPVELTSRH